MRWVGSRHSCTHSAHVLRQRTGRQPPATDGWWTLSLVPCECLALTLAVFGECVGHACWWPVPCLLGLIFDILLLGLDRFLSCLWFHWMELSPVDCGQVCLTGFRALQLVWLVKAMWMFFLKTATAFPCWRVFPSSHTCCERGLGS